MSDPNYLTLDGCARLVGLRAAQLRRAARDGQFPPPASTQRGEPYWRDDEVLRWAAATSAELATRVPLRYWPDATQPADYLGAIAHDDAVVMTWQTNLGAVAVVWNFIDPITVHLTDYLQRAHDAAIIVNVDPDFGIDGPALRAINTATPDTETDLRWADLARVLGQPMPYWPLPLRLPDLIRAWQPGAAPVTAPAQPDIDTATLLRRAATFDSEHPAHRTLLNLARVAQHRVTAAALQDLHILHESITHDSDLDVPTAIAATPLPVPEAAREDLDPTTRRAGWLDILARADTLSVQCVREVYAWDGGQDLPFSNPEEIDPTTPPGSEWAQRLHPIPRTAAFELIDYHGGGDTLTDPATDAPAVRRKDGQLIAAIPQRLPATHPLAALILAKDHIWIRTQDGTLYPAPKHPNHGLSWGYSGGGPAALAALINHLLNDINTPAPATARDTPQGLHTLTQTPWPTGTTLTRDQLETAQQGHPPQPPRN